VKECGGLVGGPNTYLELEARRSELSPTTTLGWTDQGPGLGASGHHLECQRIIIN
jgi:hypothetical protein